MGDETVRKDQYGDKVPTDLVVIADLNPADLTEKELRRVVKADWYIAGDRFPVGRGFFLLASFKAIGGLTEFDPEDAGVDLKDKNLEILRVPEPLKRWSAEDGFYTA